MDFFDNDILKDNESLFLNDLALSQDFVPKIIKHRENEQAYIADCIKLILNNREGKNLLIFGDPGIGKTLALKGIFKELEEKELGIYCILINCWKRNTPYKVALEICDNIGYKFIHNKTTEELLREVAKIINKKAAVFVLDEADKIEENNIIYNLLEDIYRKCIFFISNDKEWIASLDTRLRSRLMLDSLEFRKYTHDEIDDILRQRVEYAFVKNVWDRISLNKVIDKVAAVGDIRMGLFLLKEAANIAEQKSSKRIKEEHIDLALTRLDDYKRGKLDNEQINLYDVIKSNEGRTIKEIYEEYNKVNNMSYRNFHRKIEELNQKSIIKMEDHTSEKGGKTFLLKTKKLDEF